MDSTSLDDIKSSLDELKASQSKIISSVSNNNIKALNKKFDDIIKTISIISEENK